MATKKVLLRRKDGRIQGYSISSKNLTRHYARVGESRGKSVYVAERNLDAYFSGLAERRPARKEAFEARRLALHARLERRRRGRARAKAKEPVFVPEAPAERRAAPLHRLTIAKSFYAAGPKAGRYSEALAHFRLTVFTRNPENWPPSRLAALFSVYQAGTASYANPRNVSSEVEGLEDEEIDEDELAPGYSLDEPRIHSVFNDFAGGSKTASHEYDARL